ncbi:MAG: hypothetical protein ABIN80_13655 [Dyadobacter sp.]|uniref:hypothetical protein n=1 Tax=Dyadobacter sp. TaxID=1914288 RepID=UPI00326643D0
MMHNENDGNFSEEARRSFSGLRAKKEEIKKNTLLYKFTDSDVFFWATKRNPVTKFYDFQYHETGEKKGQPLIVASQYWGTMDDLRNILIYSKETNRSLLSCIRQRNAVLHNWNGLNSLLVVRLKETVWGWTGNIGPQTEKNYVGYKSRPGVSAPINLFGGADQVCIPRLERNHIEDVISAETVYVRDPIDDIINFLKSSGLI